MNLSLAPPGSSSLDRKQSTMPEKTLPSSLTSLIRNAGPLWLRIVSPIRPATSTPRQTLMPNGTGGKSAARGKTSCASRTEHEQALQRLRILTSGLIRKSMRRLSGFGMLWSNTGRLSLVRISHPVLRTKSTTERTMVIGKLTLEARHPSTRGL